MFKKIAEIRNKSESEKKTFAFSFALGITAVITLVWLASLFAHFNSNNEDNRAESLSPWDNIKKQFSNFGQN